MHHRAAGAVEAVAVDDGAVAPQAEEARARIARLRMRRDGADLGEAEAEPQDGIDGLAIFVETRREAERIGKVESEDIYREARIVGARVRRRQDRQRPDRQPVRRLRRQAQRHRMCEAGEEAVSGHGKLGSK